MGRRRSELCFIMPLGSWGVGEGAAGFGNEECEFAV